MHQLLEKLCNHDGLSVLWLGNNSWLFHHDGLLVANDIDLASDYRINPSPISALELAPHIDVHFMGHSHGDHFNHDMNLIFQEHGHCTFVIPSNCEQTAIEWGLSPERLHVCKPEDRFEIKGIKTQAIRALHGGKDFAVYEFANLEDCGFLWEINDLRILQPGDTVLLTQHLHLEHVDVLFVSPTEHNMHIQQSQILIDRLSPSYIFPQHHSTNVVNEQTYFWTKGYQDELFAVLKPEQQQRFKKLSIGDIHRIH